MDKECVCDARTTHIMCGRVAIITCIVRNNNPLHNTGVCGVVVLSVQHDCTQWMRLGIMYRQPVDPHLLHARQVCLHGHPLAWSCCGRSINALWLRYVCAGGYCDEMVSVCTLHVGAHGSCPITQAVVHVEALVQCEGARQQYLRLKQAYGGTTTTVAVAGVLGR